MCSINIASQFVFDNTLSLLFIIQYGIWFNLQTFNFRNLFQYNLSFSKKFRAEIQEIIATMLQDESHIPNIFAMRPH